MKWLQTVRHMPTPLCLDRTTQSSYPHRHALQWYTQHTSKNCTPLLLIFCTPIACMHMQMQTHTHCISYTHTYTHTHTHYTSYIQEYSTKHTYHHHHVCSLSITPTPSSHLPPLPPVDGCGTGVTRPPGWPREGPYSS